MTSRTGVVVRASAVPLNGVRTNPFLNDDVAGDAQGELTGWLIQRLNGIISGIPQKMIYQRSVGFGKHSVV
jgi:hypothetical protein